MRTGRQAAGVSGSPLPAERVIKDKINIRGRRCVPPQCFLRPAALRPIQSRWVARKEEMGHAEERDRERERKVLPLNFLQNGTLV